MHLYLRIAVLMVIALMAKCSEDVETHREGKAILQDKDSHLQAEQISQGYVTLRDGRRIKSKKGARLNFGILDSLLDVIDFESGNCSKGTCMSQKDCANKNGTYSDRCVEGYGVCCITDEDYEGGNVIIGEGGGDFKDPEGLEGGRPSVVDTTRNVGTRQGQEPIDLKVVYTATLKPPADTVQIKIDIIYLNILGPDDGECINDTLVINGANPGLEIPVICGKVVNPQTLYIGIDNSEGPFSIAISLACCLDLIEAPAEWLITVGFLDAAAAIEHRCLQYYTATEGTIESFNFNLDAPGMMLIEQTYSICFGYVTGYCDIVFTFERLDLGRLNGDCTNDYLLIGDNKYCDDSIDRQVTANATGPINIGVRQGSTNEIQTEGFFATYTMLGC